MTQCLNANCRYPKQLLLSTVIEPPVNNHPKCKDLVVAYGRWSLTRIKPQAGIFWEEVWAHLLYGRQFIACKLCNDCVVPCCY